MDNVIIMTEEYWANSHFSIARHYEWRNDYDQ